jgi:hypothetical protein
MAKPIKITILGDASSFEKAAKGVEHTLGGLSSGFGKMAGVVAGAFAADRLISFGKDIVGAASDMNETVSKTGVIFGDSAGAILKWSESAADKMGLSKQAALDAAGGFAIFGQAAGLQGKNLEDFTTGLVGRASDLASFYNTSTEDAAAAIQAALRGETEPIRRYGVMLDDATMRQKAFEMGLISSVKEGLDPSQKALVAQQLILDKTSVAAGDFERTSDGLANKQRILSAKFQDLKAKLGAGLLPIVEKVVTFLADYLLPVLERVGKAFSEDGFGGGIRELGNIIRAAWPQIQTALGQMFQAFVSWIQVQGPIIAAQLGQWAKEFVAWIGPQIPPALQELGRLIGALANWLIDVGLPLAVEKLVEFGQAFVDWVGPQIPPLLLELTKLVIAIGEWVVTEAVPKLTEQALKLAWALTGFAWDLSLDLIKGLGASLLELAKHIPGWALDFAKWGGSWGLEMVTKLVYWFHVELPLMLAEKVGEVAGKVAGFGADLGKALLNGLIEIWNRADLVFPRVEVPGWVPGMGGKGFGGFDIFPDAPLVRAMGGPADGLVKMNERGPEMVVLPKGSNVIPAHATPQGNVNVYVTNPTPRPKDVGDAVAWSLKTSGV